MFGMEIDIFGMIFSSVNLLGCMMSRRVVILFFNGSVGCLSSNKHITFVEIIAREDLNVVLAIRALGIILPIDLIHAGGADRGGIHEGTDLFGQ